VFEQISRYSNRVRSVTERYKGRASERGSPKSLRGAVRAWERRLGGLPGAGTAPAVRRTFRPCRPCALTRRCSSICDLNPVLLILITRHANAPSRPDKSGVSCPLRGTPTFSRQQRPATGDESRCQPNTEQRAVTAQNAENAERKRISVRRVFLSVFSLCSMRSLRLFPFGDGSAQTKKRKSSKSVALGGHLIPGSEPWDRAISALGLFWEAFASWRRATRIERFSMLKVELRQLVVLGER